MVFIRTEKKEGHLLAKLLNYGAAWKVKCNLVTPVYYVRKDNNIFR